MTVSCSIADGSTGAPGCRNSAVSVTDHSRFCYDCAHQGRTCCQGHDIYVTQGDCRRIFMYTRQSDFYEYRSCCDPAYADQSDDPTWQQHVFRADGRRRVLKRSPNGDCILLTPSGCSLALSARPLVCRLFPHLYSASGIAAGWDLACPAANNAAAAAIESDIAGVAQGEAAQWHQLLYDELLWERFGDENRINL